MKDEKLTSIEKRKINIDLLGGRASNPGVLQGSFVNSVLPRNPLLEFRGAVAWAMVLLGGKLTLQAMVGLYMMTGRYFKNLRVKKGVVSIPQSARLR